MKKATATIRKLNMQGAAARNEKGALVHGAAAGRATKEKHPRNNGEQRTAKKQDEVHEGTVAETKQRMGKQRQ